MDQKKNFYYEEVHADAALSDFVHYFWQSQSQQDSEYTVLPDGYFDLIIQFENNKVISIDLFGLFTRQIDIKVPAGRKFRAITFKPLAAEYLLLTPVKDIVNQSREFRSKLWDDDWVAGDNFSLFVSRISERMLAALNNKKRRDSRKLKMFELIFNSSGTIPVSLLAQEICWTQRQINRYFHDKLGMSLKTYNNILRCAAAYGDLRDGELFPKDYYYDQSHFIKEVKKYTGQIPTQLHKNKDGRVLQFLTLPGK